MADSSCASVCNRSRSLSLLLQYTQEELESMIFSLRRFRVVLTEIEEQVSEEQASVFTALSASIR